MSQKAKHIKPQDVVLLLKLLLRGSDEKRIADLSMDLGISASEVTYGIRRLQDSSLVKPGEREPLRANALEFLVYGLKYIFPAQLGSVQRGLPTGHSAAPLSKKIKASKEDQHVWAHSEGEVRGHSIVPLYPSVPEAALKDAELHKLLALCDAIRIGRARERNIAVKELERGILKK